MKRILFLLFLLVSIYSFGQTIVADKGTFRKSVTIRGINRIDSVKNDTIGIAGRVHTLLTAKAIYDFVNGRTLGGGGGGGSVTSVAAGFGHTFSTITSTGSVVSDTTSGGVQSYVRGKKIIDSLNTVYTPMTRTLTSGFGIQTIGNLTANRTIAGDSTSGGFLSWVRGDKLKDSLGAIINLRVPTSRTLTPGFGILPIGDLTANRTVGADTSSGGLLSWIRGRKIIDSLAGLISSGGGGSVLSVASGFGTSFSTITSTGSVIADTTSGGIQSWVRGKKIIDSLNTVYTPMTRTLTSGFGIQTIGNLTANRTVAGDSTSGGFTSWVRSKKIIDSLAAIMSLKVGSIGTINSQTKSANGAVIPTNGSLVLQTVDATNPGLMTSAQKVRLDSNSYIVTPVTGTQLVYQISVDSLRIKSLVAGTNISLTPNGDTTLTINATGGGGGGVSSVAAGFGHTFSTITSTGSVIADTTSGGIQSWVRGKKIIDSLNTVYTPMTRTLTSGFGIQTIGNLTANRTIAGDSTSGGFLSWVRGKKLADSLAALITAAGGSVTTTDNSLVTSGMSVNMRKAVQSITFGTTSTMNAANGPHGRLVLTGNTTLAITNPQDGDFFTVTFVQNGTGGNGVTLPGGGTAIISTAANDSTTLSAFYRNHAFEWRANGQAQLNGTGFVKATGMTISYDNSTYTPTSRTLSNGFGIASIGDLSANRTITGDSTSGGFLSWVRGKKIIDSLGSLIGGGGGGVSSVSAGFGHSFSTITSTGSVIADTTSGGVQSWVRGKKIIDSLNTIYTPMTRTLTSGFGIQTIGNLTANRTVAGDSTSGGFLSWVRGKKIIDSLGALIGGGSGLTINSTPITSGTANRLLLENGSNQVSQSANLSFPSNVLNVGGAATFTGSTLTTYTTPAASSVNTKFGIANQALGNFEQLFAAGVSSGASSSSRVMSLFDARTGAHNPTIAVFEPGESESFGLSWEGSGTMAFLKTSSSAPIGMKIGSTELFNFTTSNLLSVPPIQSGLAGSTLGKLILAGNTSGTLTFQPSAAAGNITNTWPGSHATGYLKNDGSGGLTWDAGTGSGVTSVAAGFGHTFSTITSTGSVVADTTSGGVQSYVRGKKIIDSLAVLISAKQPQLNGTGFVKATGSTISYDNSTYTPTSRTLSNGFGIASIGDLSANRTIAGDSTSGGFLSWVRGKKIIDSLAALISAGGGGTVTSVSAGFGHSFSTITSSGAVIADTTSGGLQSWVRGKKIIDSLNTIYTPMTRTLTSGFGIQTIGNLTANRTIAGDSTSGGFLSWVRGKKIIDSLSTINTPMTRTLTNGYGVQTIGDLTTNRTISADTNQVTSRLRDKKIIDSLSAIITASTETSGAYLPTWTSVTNAGTPTADTLYWSKDGNSVRVWGGVTIDPVANGHVQARFNLPFTSNIVAVRQLAGSGETIGNGAEAGQPGAIYGDVANDQGILDYVSVSSAFPAVWYINLSYRIY